MIKSLSVVGLTLISLSIAHAQDLAMQQHSDKNRVAKKTLEEEKEQKREEIEKVIVVGQRIEEYHAIDALTGTKSGTLLRDLPFSINVVPHQLIEDRGLTFLGEALDNVSGTQRRGGYGGTASFGAFIRGFGSGSLTLRNGFRDMGFLTLRDTANVERYEVLKGPASILYGQMQPGGITNTLSKQPTTKPLNRITGLFGSDQYRRTELDSGGPLSDRLFYRANIAIENAGSFRDHVKNKSEFVAPVISWIISNDTRWTFEAEYKHSNFTWDLGLPFDPISLTAPVSRFLGEPDGKSNVTSNFLSSTFEHKLNADWLFRQKVQFSKTRGNYDLRSPYGFEPDQRSVSRVAYVSPAKAENFSLQNELVGNFNSFGVSHQAVVGLEFNRSRHIYDFFFQPLASIDFYRPIYGAQPEDGFPLFGNDEKDQGTAIYFQNLVSVNKDLKLLAGVRYESVKLEDYDRLEKVIGRKSRDAAVTPQLGIVYQTQPASTLYASYSSSFLPSEGKQSNGAYLDPERGHQFEMGLKQDLFNGKASLNLAAYWITKKNVATIDPVNSIYRIQTGEQKSQGVELDLTGQIMRGWDVVLTGAYNDAFVSKDKKIAIGTRLPNAANWSGSAWNKLSISDRLAVGVGIYSSSKRKAEMPNPDWWLPSYTRYDAMLSYSFEQLRLQLNLKNLSNKRIYDLGGAGIVPQTSRAALFTASYNFR